jgi:transposase
MYIRQVKKKFSDSDKEYIQHRLVESIRTPNGPRQRVLLNLGTLAIPADKFKDLANAIEARLGGQPALLGNDPEIDGLARHFCDIIIARRLAEAKSVSDESPADFDAPQFETVDVNSATTSNARAIGAEQIALAQMEELSFFNILHDLGFDDGQQKRAAAQLIARMVHPASERETARFLRENSAVGELLDDDFSKISDNSLHRTADLLLKNKTALEDALAAKSRDLFSLDETLILYDLTNTFFESGKTNSDIARYGKSKEKRADCPLVSLALVIDGRGFPKRSRIYKGNVAEAETLKTILDELPDAPGESGRRPTVVIDAGIATEENLKLIREKKKCHYVAVSRKRNHCGINFDGKLWSALDLARGRTLEVKSARVGEEIFLLCKSEERAARDEAILKGRCERFEADLAKLKAGLSKPRTVKKYDAIMERIGRIKERNKVGWLYNVSVTNKEGRAVELTFTKKEAKVDEFGEYVIRTDRTELADGEISMIHRALTMVEGSFRWLKQDFGMRPNFHQLDARMEGHIFITVLAYFVVAPLLSKLGWGGDFIRYCGDEKRADRARTPEKPNPKQQGNATGFSMGANENDEESPTGAKLPTGWRSVVNAMSTMVRVTTSFTCKDGRRMHVRTTCDPNPTQLAILRKLGLHGRPLKRVIYKEAP